MQNCLKILQEWMMSLAARLYAETHPQVIWTNATRCGWVEMSQDG